MAKDALTRTTLEMASVDTDDLAASSLLSLSAAVLGSANPSDTLTRSTRFVADRLGVTECACLLIDHGSDGRDLVYAADAYQDGRRGRHLPERSLSYEVQAVLDRGREWAQGEPSARDRRETPPILRGTLKESSAHQAGTVAGLLVPLISERRVLGVLWLGARRAAGRHTDAELALVQATGAVLAQAAGALVREREQLEQAREQAREHGRQLERLEQTNAKLREVIASRSRELSVKAHDMRSPLGVIQGHLSVLERVLPDGPEQDSLSAIRRQGERLDGLLDEVVGDGRRRAQGLRLEPVDLGPWLTACAGDFTFLARKAGVQLEFDIAETLGIRRVDSDKLEEIVGNLVDNAIKYSGRGGTVWFTATLRDEETLRLTVSDSGPGLTDEALEHGFQMWFRDRSHRNIHGSGVGLASVLELIELMGGTVEGTNLDVGGACFTVEVPAFLDELAHDDTNPLPIQRYRVMIINGDPEELGQLAEALRPQFDVLTARSEREALWLTQQSPIDCAVVDLDVPMMTGFATANALRRDPERAHLPILFTADDDLGAISLRRRGSAIEDVIVRPFEPAALVSQIAAAIAESVQRSALVRTGRTDPLTGLLSRKYAEPELDRQLEQMRQRAGFLSVLLIDIDRLSEVNRRLGESAGDSLLRAMGRTLQEVTRSSEFATRWGGDELMVVLPDTTGSAARNVAERVADRLSECRAGEAQRTVSVGVATADVSDPVDALQLIERARAALDVAREAGGGRVAAWERRPQAPTPDVGAMTGKRLLIVDDDRDVLDTLALYFSRTTNLVVETATSMLDAVEKAENKPPQVVIIDLRLPDGTGFELLHRLRQTTNPSLPAIAYTGRTDIATIDRTEQAGFNACLTKTAQLDHLADEVNRWLH